MPTLYRKYRPQTFEELVGQRPIALTLMNELRQNEIAHAYLFTGPRGVGKTTVARLLAKAVNCEKRREGEYEPCDECNTCKEISRGSMLDVIEIDAASHTGVDHVRESVIESARVAPSRGKFKVFIIDEVHMLSASAFNALLKTLEEPPAHAVFVLATTEAHKVPETIISRCQRFDFRKIGVQNLVEKLKRLAEAEKVKVEEDVYRLVARRAGGSLRDAESIFGQLLTFESPITRAQAELVLPHSEMGEAVKLVEFIKNGDARSALLHLRRLADEGVDPLLFLADTVEVLRSLLYSKSTGALDEFAFDSADSKPEEILSLSASIEPAQYLRWIEILLKAREASKRAEIPLLPFELALVEMCLGPESFTASFRPEPHLTPAPAEPVKSAPVIKVDFKNEKQKKEKTADKNIATDAVVSLEVVRVKWPEILKRVEGQNFSLPIVLNVAAPIEVRGTTLVIGVKFPLLCDRLNEQKNRALLEEIIASLLGTNLKIEGIVQADIVPEAPSPEPVKREANSLKDLLETFGSAIAS